ncbi:hypothetical protein TNCV_3235221 [Trichonephila clavipes]|nr:hypothetical protein TNCV_3235221 [Trichonephila clavipes]
MSITVVDVSFPKGRNESCQSLRQIGLLYSTQILRESTLGVVRVLSLLFPFYQPRESTCGSMAIYNDGYRTKIKSHKTNRIKSDRPKPVSNVRSLSPIALMLALSVALN